MPREATGILAILSLGLVLLMQSCYLTNAVGIDPTSKDDKMTIAFAKNGFAKKHKIIFPGPFLEQFYACLCSTNAYKCSFKIQHFEDVLKVTKVNVVDSLSFSSTVFHGNTMVCRTQLLSNMFICKAEKLDSFGCPKESNSGFQKLEFFDSSCRKCINLCWQDFTVTYTSTSSRAVPTEGVCPSSGLESETRHTGIPISTVRETVQNSNFEDVSLTDVYASTTDTIYMTSYITVSENRTDSNATSDRSREKFDPELLEIVLMIIACAMFLTISIACVLLFTRRSEKRGERGTDSERHFYIKPHSDCQEDSSEARNEILMSDLGHNVFTVGGRKLIYTSPMDIYCTILDADMMAPWSADPDIVIEGNGAVELEPAKQAETVNLGGCTGKLDNDTNPNSRTGVFKSAADPPQNMLEAGERSTSTTSIRLDPRRKSHLYSRLNSKTEKHSDTPVVVPKTYNIYDSAFKKTGKYPRIREGATSEQRDMYCLAAVPQTTDGAVGDGNKKSQNEGSAVRSECCSSRVQSVGFCEQNNDYFTLENGEDVAIVRPCKPACSENPPQCAYFVLEGGIPGHDVVNVSGLNSNEAVIQTQTQNYKWVENPENHYQELTCMNPTDKPNCGPDSSLSNEGQEHDYFELESNAADSEIDNSSSNVDGDHDENSGNDLNVSQSHIYHELP